MAFLSLTRAAVIAVCLAGSVAGLPAMAQNAAAPAVAPDPAKVATTEQIYANLHILDILGTAMVHSFVTNDSYNVFTPDQRVKAGPVFLANLTIVKPYLLHKMAVAHAGHYTTDQLNRLLDLSKIKYVQDLLAKAVDDSLPTPSKSTMTPAEAALYKALDNEQFTEDFLTEAGDFNVIQDDIFAIGLAAFKKVGAGPQTAPAGT